jgi:hypothetical protein
MTCPTCGERRAEGEFNWRNRAKGLRHSSCRYCKMRYQHNWYLKHRTEHIAVTAHRRRLYRTQSRHFVLEYLKTHPCEVCTETDPVVLDFHHRHPSRKTKEIAQMLGTYTTNKVILEIRKCRVLCSNCHRRITARHQGWYKSQRST